MCHVCPFASYRKRSFPGRKASARAHLCYGCDGSGARILAPGRWRAGSFFWLAFSICVRGIFAVVAASAFLAAFGETHHGPRAEFDFSTIAKNYWSLSTDRRFVVPAATVSLILGALFAMFSALPRVLIEGLDFTPMQLGLFFAGTVMVVFSAGIIATKIVPHLGLDRSICIGLALACVGGGMVLLFALLDGRFLPFLVGACVFLLGMGMVNPLCSAQALSPFGDRAGAASA